MMKAKIVLLAFMLLLQLPILPSIHMFSASPIQERVIDRSSPIQPYHQNPYYWQYQGKPVMLTGGSKEDNLFQIEGLAGHLDTLASVGGNYVRNTMSSRDEGNVWPFFQQPDGQYDLNRLSDTYFQRFEELLQLTARRDIIVQIEVWDRFDFAREPWLENPYNPANNINYTAEESKLAKEYAKHPGSNENPFFRSIPAHDNNKVILKYQQAQVDRLLEISLQYPNVLYTMDNETNATPEWGAYWAKYIQDKAAEAGVKVYTTEMWDAWDLTDEQHKRTLDHPELYAFADISQNNHNTGQKHWNNLQWVREYVAHHPRPLNHVKIYGANTGKYGTDKDAVERFWRSIVGGAASVRFHRPPSGLGLNVKVQTQLKSARLLLASIDIFSFKPDKENVLLSERTENEAYLTHSTREQYVVYFPDGGKIMLDLTETENSFNVQWLDIEQSRWLEESQVKGGKKVSLECPGRGNWVVLLKKR